MGLQDIHKQSIIADLIDKLGKAKITGTLNNVQALVGKEDLLQTIAMLKDYKISLPMPRDLGVFYKEDKHA